ncbi:MAG TPA: hypothetical protein VGO00_14025, partial [Kofleriaceae bacterium]|nr:hypothetical protein [Kofleriaceae bacterium]
MDIAAAIEAVPAAQGYFIVDTDRGERVYMLGPRTALEGAMPMLDWRSSPIAEAFFRHAPGESYEIEVDGKPIAGRMRESYVIANRSPLVL